MLQLEIEIRYQIYLHVYLCLIDARSKAVEKVALNISCDIL